MNTLGRTLVTLMVAAMPLVAHAQDAEPVHFSKLITFLPDKVEGWTAQKPQGSTTAVTTFKITEVSREYSKGDDQRVTIKITDGTANQMFAAAQAALMMEYSNESTEGYEKGYKLDGYSAHEKYQTEEKSGSLTVLVDKRFMLVIETSGLPNSAMAEWFKKIDTKKLAELKPEPKKAP